MKKCGKCKQEKLLSGFSKNRSRGDGLQYWCKDCHVERYLNPVAREAQRKAAEDYYRKHPEKAKARYAVKYAIKTGKLVRSIFCEECGLPAETEGHHPDYTKPLVVDWLCLECHKELNTILQKV